MTASSVRAFAPATVANLGPGLDVLGLALTGAGDTVAVARDSGRDVRIVSPGDPRIPADAQKNTAGIAAALVRERAGERTAGISISVEKGLPLAGGLGGSAASAVAAAVAVNALFGNVLSREELLEPCLEAEAAVAGRHADNVGAALFGGVVLVESVDPPSVVPLAYPRELLVVIATPRYEVRTEEARSRLPRTVDLRAAVEQASRVGGLVSALASGDWDLLRRSVRDCVAEPARAPLLPGFLEAKHAALEAGAIGCSISGSGPTAFAFARDSESAQRVADAMTSSYAALGIEAGARVSRIDAEGARVVR